MKRVFRFLLKCCVWFVILTVLWVVIYRYIPIYYTPLMAIRSFENTEKSSTFKHNWVDIEDNHQTLSFYHNDSTFNVGIKIVSNT